MSHKPGTSHLPYSADSGPLTAETPPLTAREIMTAAEAADYVRLSKWTLDTMRVRGGGPKFCRLRGSVRYRKVDLDAWVAACVRSSTSEAA